MSNQAVTVIGQKQLMSQEDLDILRNSKFKGFSDREIAYCAKTINLLQLSPFLNQVHFTRRTDKKGVSQIVVQIGIDGFRLTAQRAGGYAGSDEPVFEYDEKDVKKQNPVKATVTVYKIVSGVRCPFTAAARWDEYYPHGQFTGMWDKMPHNQLAKCAEALALRKAFPAELSSLYTEDEMHQAEKAVDALPIIVPEQPVDGDGITTESYVIPYGPLAKQAIENADPVKLRAYVKEIEDKAKRMNKPIPPWGQELIRNAEPLIAAFENQQEPGWED